LSFYADLSPFDNVLPFLFHFTEFGYSYVQEKKWQIMF
jgi:hypothetical protein